MRAAPLAYADGQVKPGWIALFLVLFLILATVLLWRSMNTQLGKIRVPPEASFEDRTPGAGEPAEPSQPSGSESASAAAERPDSEDGDPPPSPEPY